MKNAKWDAEAEMVMMGFTLPIDSEEHLEHLLAYFKSPCNFTYDPKAVIQGSKRFISNLDKLTYKHINLARVNGDMMIAMTMTTEEDEDEDRAPYDLLSKYGVFGYVYNINDPICSELGYSYFGKKGSRVGRIG